MIRRIQIDKYRREKSTEQESHIFSLSPQKMQSRKSTLQPVLPLIAEKLPTTEEDKSKFVAMDLKTRAGTNASAPTYRKYIRVFEEGSPQEWIDLLKNLHEIWAQNSVNRAADRVATVRSIVKGESLVAFEAALEEEQQGEDGGQQPLTIEKVQNSLDAVTKTIFPHRALEIQKLWMQRAMKKPFDLSTRSTAAAITRINNSLPLFPGGSEDSKFSKEEIVGLLEWSLPQAWRAKFDLDGYIPTLHSKAKLIESCEAIERNEKMLEESKKGNKKGKKKEGSTGSNGSSTVRRTAKSSNVDKNYFCSVHGKNSTHASADCWTLKNREKGQKSKSHNGAEETNTSTKFSNRKFRKEVNLLAKAKGSSKEKVLELFANAVQKEQSKLTKLAAKRKVREESSDSDSENSVNVIDNPAMLDKPVKKKKTKKVSFNSDQTEEEKAFLKKVMQMDEDSSTNSDE